jgi:deoxyribodipyrimidine photolyase-related protein
VELFRLSCKLSQAAPPPRSIDGSPRTRKRKQQGSIHQRDISAGSDRARENQEMLTAALIYPHQLFESHPAVCGADRVYLVEDPLFFRQYHFHRQKLIMHRASMKRFASESDSSLNYIETGRIHKTGDIVEVVRSDKCHKIQIVDPNDDWLLTRLRSACHSHGIALNVIPDPDFLTPEPEVSDFVAGKQKLFFTDFYIRQRKRLGILLTPDGKPLGGKWSFDTDNRKKLPSNVLPPSPTPPRESRFVREARRYVQTHFPSAPGTGESFNYPVSRPDARSWLAEFMEHRFPEFGAYEDSISAKERILFHSVLTPAMNIGLLSPREVIDCALKYADQVPLNSLEGFVRQVIGWREFVRLVYLNRGRVQRTGNFLDNQRTLPTAFYTASTGIQPVDHVIRTVLETAYCHHIERLMILGNFMLLCDINPNHVYRWFMELFIDAYDWVMVPNVYGMSQFADGGGMTTKPYISGSAYVRKMSDFPKGEWCAIWDALYWRFIHRHSEVISANPRTAVILKMKEKLGLKLDVHLRIAEEYLARLHN